MKILFVCRGNTGRSQVAQELYNLHSGTQDASSAGTKVNDGIETVQEKPNIRPVLDAANELGIDISTNRRQQLTEDNIADFDRLVVLADPEDVPGWLREDPKFEYWETEDIKGKNRAEAKIIMQEIEKKVIEMLRAS